MENMSLVYNVSPKAQYSGVFPIISFWYFFIAICAQFFISNPKCYGRMQHAIPYQNMQKLPNFYRFIVNAFLLKNSIVNLC